MIEKFKKQRKRKLRTRSKIMGTEKRPRLSVFRSNQYIYAQIIDDEKQKTILGVSDKMLLKEEKNGNESKINRAKKVGVLLAKKALAKKIKKIVFDRGSYAYYGRIKALAEGAREGGLVF